MDRFSITCKNFSYTKKSRQSLGFSDGSQDRRPKAMKRMMICGTWNVQGSRGRMMEIVSETEKLKIDILTLTETKRKGQGTEMTGNYVHLFSGVPKDNRAKRGVSILINKRFKNKITNWDPIDENIIKVNLHIYGRRIAVLGVYTISDDEPVAMKDTFFEKLNEVLADIGNTRDVIVLGDFNSRTGRKINDKVIGPYGEDNINDNGTRLIELCTQNDMRICNGFYQHKEIHKYTWEQPTRQLKSIIDYLIIKQRSDLKLEDIRVKRGATCGSDHYLLRAKIYIPRWNTVERNQSNKDDENTEQVEYPKYNLHSLLEDSVKYLYQRRLDEYLPDSEDLNTQETYSSVIESIHKAAREALGTQQQQKSRNIWWTREIEQLIQQKKQAYLKWLTTKDQEDKQAYDNIKRETRQKINHSKNEMWDRKCQEIETYIGGRKCTEAWEFIKKVKKTRSEKVTLQNISQKQWKEHYEHLLQEERPQYIWNSIPINIQGETVDIDETTIRKAINELKNGKSCGPEGVYAELLKSGTGKLIKILTKLFNDYLNGQEVPKEWKVAYISSIYKKGNRNDCGNYRGISVTSSMSRLYGRILRDLIEKEYVEEEEQSGFRSGRSCNDNVFTMKQIIEKRSAVNLETHMLFIDLTKAYDNIPMCLLWEALHHTNINQTLITAVKNLYADSVSKIKTGNRLSTPFNISKGLRQGCCISPTLFKVYIKEALRKWKRKCAGMGVPLENTTIYSLQFADDQAVIAGDNEDLTYMTRKLKETYDEWGLTMNIQKTRYLSIGTESQNLQLNDSDIIKACEEYKYLGITFDKTGTDDKEIRSRIIQAKKAIGCLNGILWSRQLTTHRKYNIYNAMIKSSLLHGSETWRMTERNKRMLEATEMDALRRSARISRMDRVRNEDIRRRVGLEDTIIKDFEQKQLTWYGHVQRMADYRLPKQAMNWIPYHKKKRGRPKITWKEGIRKAMSLRNMQDGQWEDRRQWRLDIGQRRRTF